MKTFLKIVLCVLGVLVVLKLFPLFLIPALVGMALLLLAGVLLAGGVATIAATGLSLVIALLAVVLVVAAALSPIWIPVLAVCGIVSLCRRRKTPTAATVV